MCLFEVWFTIRAIFFLCVARIFKQKFHFHKCTHTHTHKKYWGIVIVLWFANKYCEKYAACCSRYHLFIIIFGLFRFVGCHCNFDYFIWPSFDVRNNHTMRLAICVCVHRFFFSITCLNMSHITQIIFWWPAQNEHRKTIKINYCHRKQWKMNRILNELIYVKCQAENWMVIFVVCL